MAKAITSKVIENKKVTTDIFRMSIRWQGEARPGQFVMIDCKGKTLLKRPFSIHSLTEDSLSILYQVKGVGTKNLSLFRQGDEISILGPLGKGFTIKSQISNIMLVGGGIGIAPLLFLAERLNSRKIRPTILLGFKTQPYLLNGFKSKGSILVATEDGSSGEKGTIEKLIKKINLKKYGIIYGCGPKPLLKFLKDVSEANKIPCQLSLEERMGCGIGACLSCACKVKDGEKWHYRRVCKEGPVFWADRIIL